LSDISRRLRIIESTAAETRAEVTAIKALLPHLATKADLYSLEARFVLWHSGTVIGTALLALVFAKLVS